jgi:uncharacterized protein YjiS (DUF1127 family)
MRFELQSFSDAMIAPARESARQDEWIDLDRRDEWLAVSRERLLRTNSDRTGWWCAIATATSVVAAHALAGLAWGAVVMYPNFLGHEPGRLDDEERVDDPFVLEPAEDRPMSHGAAIRSRILHSEEMSFITNGVVILENQAARQGPMPPETEERSGFQNLRTWMSAMPARLWTRAVRAHRNHRAIAELQALDDRMLQDIGISRSQIWATVRKEDGPRV